MKFFDSSHRSLPVSYEEYRLAAKRRLPAPLFTFIDGGSFYEETLHANSLDLQKLQLRRKILKNVSKIDTSATVLGQNLSFPLILGPVGFAGLFTHLGEAKAARAAASQGIPFGLSAASILSIAQLKRAVPASFWFQLSLFKDRGYTQYLLDQASKAHTPTLFLTVDFPMPRSRYQYLRSLTVSRRKRFWDTLKHLPWWLDVYCRKNSLVLGNMPPTSLVNIAEMRTWMAEQVDNSATWNDFAWLRDRWPGKLVIKGVMDPDDAVMAKKMGADGIVVSNHGGRQLDTTPSTLSVLPAIVQAVAGDMDILFDGGIRTGLDLIKPLALGARACLIGRGWAYPLASHGEKGVADMISLLRSELESAMAQCGVSRIADLNSDLFFNSRVC